MHQSYEFYTARAKESAAAAKAAKLDNVRERELRAEKTWRGLAEQARSVAEQRDKIVREKERARAAEEAEECAAEREAASDARDAEEAAGRSS